MTKQSIVEQYFEQYRQTKGRIKELRRELKASQERSIEIQDKCDKLSAEIYAMQRIITLMVDNGWDPVETKLKMDTDKIMDHTLWDRVLKDMPNNASIGRPITFTPDTVSMPISAQLASTEYITPIAAKKKWFFGLF